VSIITAPSITAALNTGVLSGNPLCTSAANLTAVTTLQLVQIDTALLNLYFAAAGTGGIGSTPVNLRVASGVALSFAGKPTDDLAATTVLFLANAFTEQQDANDNYFYQAVLALNTDEIAAQFAALGDGVNQLPCLIDIDLSVPAADGVPALLGTYQIAAILLRKVYLGTESSPVPATPPYPTPATIAAAVAEAAAALPVSALTGLTGGGASNLDGLNVNTAPTALPTYATLLIVLFTGATIVRLELNTDPVNGAQVINPPDDTNRSWRTRI
jgi:hypothetical protein